MKSQLMEEIQRLTRLIEERKKTASDKFNHNKDISNVQVHLNRQFATANVHVNPNFKVQNPVIHINPRVRTTPQIHVNPRIMKDVSSINDGKYSYSNIKCSVYVNPKLMTKLSSSVKSKIVDKEINVSTNTQSHCSRLKFVNNVGTPTMDDKRNNNSSVVVLSQRKLVRVRRTTKGSSIITPTGTPIRTKKFTRSPFKKVKSVPLKSIKTSMLDTDALQCTNKSERSFELNRIRTECGRYKIDRTNRSTSAKAKSGSANDNAAVITIGGILYKSSRNQLVRGSLSVKKKRLGNLKNDKFVIARSGKNLRRLKVVRDTNNRIGQQSASLLNTGKGDKCPFVLSQKINYKHSMSTKAKRRSIQTLWNKMRKNNQPCLLFQKFGYCANYNNGVCPKLHDRKQVSLCKKFLQSKCFANNCPLSHDVGPEKMPTCKYFLEGCCTRDACPYLHVKMSSNTLICIDFLQGYCSKGNECKRRHEYTCPEFDKLRKCSKGEYCPYPHKSQTAAIGHTDKHLQTEPKGSEGHLNVVVTAGVDGKNGHVVERTNTKSDTVYITSLTCAHENKLRYYERTDTLNDDMDERRKVILKKINAIKNAETVKQLHRRHNAAADTTIQATPSRTEHVQLRENECSELAKTDCGKPIKRRPIGSLPAYIPIN